MLRMLLACITQSELAFLCKQFMLGNLLRSSPELKAGNCRKVAHAHLHIFASMRRLFLTPALPHSQILLHAQVCQRKKLTISQSFMQLIARGFCKKLEKFESFQWLFSISVRVSRWNDPLEKIRHFGNFEVPVPTLPSRTTIGPSMYKPLQI